MCIKARIKKPVVGDTYFYVPYDRRNKPETLKVTKVGREYFYTEHVDCEFSHRQFRILTGIEANGKYMPQGVVYDSEEAYLQYLDLKEKIKQLPQMLEYLDDEDFLEIYELVKSKIENYGKKSNTEPRKG